MRGTDFLQCPLLRIILLCLFLNPAPNLYSAQDYIKENPELDRLLTKSSPQDRDRLNKMLSSMPAEDQKAENHIQSLSFSS